MKSGISSAFGSGVVFMLLLLFITGKKYFLQNLLQFKYVLIVMVLFSFVIAYIFRFSAWWKAFLFGTIVSLVITGGLVLWSVNNIY